MALLSLPFGSQPNSKLRLAPRRSGSAIDSCASAISVPAEGEASGAEGSADRPYARQSRDAKGPECAASGTVALLVAVVANHSLAAALAAGGAVAIVAP